MYGDIQVMSSMGGGTGITTESLFPPSMHQGHHNFDFLNSTMPSFSDFSESRISFPSIIPKEETEIDRIVRSGKEEMESGSGSEQIEGGLSGNEHEGDDQQPPAKRKRYHRHTARQIQEMEALFKECQHPDDKQRMRLSQELGLKPRQVKFWFQNRRTQLKAQQDRADNIALRADNENLRNENYRLQNALRGLICQSCGGPGISIDEQQLRMENARLREELDRYNPQLDRYNPLLVPQYCAQPIQAPAAQGPAPPFLTSNLDLDMNMYPRPYDQEASLPSCSEMMQLNPLMGNDNTNFDTNFAAANGLLIMDHEKSLELALGYKMEVTKMCELGEPLWMSVNDARKEVLNEEEHNKIFPWHAGRIKKQDSSGMRYEGTRGSTVVIMNSINLVDSFVDAEKWTELFPSIIARAKTLQVISPGVNGHSNTLQLMYTELQMLSPLVPTREMYFLRYCEQHVDGRGWVIVDFPLDSFHETYQPLLPRYRRRPSGCIIRDMPNGYSKVTWVEHAEIEDEPVHHIFNEFVSSGMAFGAQRWLAVLQRQCQRLASLLARNISDLGVIPSPEARKNLMDLAQRMIRTFCVNISGSCGQSWTTLSNSVLDDTVKVMTRKVTEPGQPNGLILSAVATVWLPHPHYQVFDLLRDEHRPSQLDVISNGNPLQEVAHIANGAHRGNCISLLRVNVASNSSQNVELMLQESCTDESGSLVVYSTVDVDAIKLAMNGQDQSCIPLLPLGFVIIPVEQYASNGSSIAISEQCNEHNNSPATGGGCLLTIGLQFVENPDPTAKLNLTSVNLIDSRLRNAVHQITAALGEGSTPAGGNNNSICGSSGNQHADSGGNAGGSYSVPPAEDSPPKKLDENSTPEVN